MSVASVPCSLPLGASGDLGYIFDPEAILIEIMGPTGNKKCLKHGEFKHESRYSMVNIWLECG